MAAAPAAPVYVAAAPTVVPAVAQSAGDQATVVVQLPADARMWVDGQAADLTSATRSFQTPALDKGRDYYYTVRAEATRDGKVLSQSQRITVRAGQVSRVDFGDLTAAARVTPAAASAPAHVTVRLPENARLFVDDVAYPEKSVTPKFDTPALQPGRTYFYTFRVEAAADGRTRSDSRRVEVKAGKQVEVDFRNLARVASR
jgi:uncharacterized protein (TIGR03000 family)